MGGAGLHGRAFIPLLSSFACAIPGHHGDARDRRPPRSADHHPGRAADDLLGAHSGLHADHLRLHPRPRGLGLHRPAGPGDVRALRHRHRQRAWRLVPRQATSFWREHPTPPFMLELPDYKLPRLRSVAIGLYDARQDFPAARRHHHLRHDGADLVPGLVSATARGRNAARHRLQPRRHDRPRHRAAAGTGRIQLADQRGADPRHGRARGGGGRARHRLRDRGRQGSGRADRPGAGQQVEPRHRAFAAGLVHLRAAVRVDARRDPPRDRQLALDGGRPSPTCWRWPMSAR